MTHFAGNKPCRSCGEQRSRIFHSLKQVPLRCCELIKSREQALAVPTGHLQLSFCEACGFIQNDLFDQSLIDYSKNYEDKVRCDLFSMDLEHEILAL